MSESYVYTACPGWGDHDYCALKTIVEDGKIVRMEAPGYDDPEQFCCAHICQKGALAGRQPYSPARLTAPLKRKAGSKRGEDAFEQISWDEALDEIAQALNKVAKENGPSSVVVWSLGAGVPAGGLSTLLSHRWIALFGATDPVNSIGLDNGPFYSQFYNFGSGGGLLHGMNDPRNYIGSDYIIVWGGNPVENQMRMTMPLVKAREAGAKIIDIGIIFDATAGFADEFVAVKAGSDGALALAMCNYIIEHDLYDAAFMKEHTVAPYAVDPDSGKLCKNNGEYVVADDICGSVECCGKTCQTAFQLLKEHLKQYTLDWASGKCGLAPAKIKELAEDYAKADNAYIAAALGMRYTNQGETYRALHLLGTLTGNYGRPGAGVQENATLTGYPVAFNDGPVAQAEGTADKTNIMRMHSWFADADRPDSPYHALIMCNGNPIHQQPTRGRWKRIIENMEIVVDIDIWKTDSGLMSDYILPDCMPFECENLVSGFYNHVVLQEPAIAPPAEVREEAWMWSELAKRCGFGQYFDKTTEEWNAIRLETQYPPIATVEPKITMERLHQEKAIRMNVPDKPYFDPFAGLQFETPTGKIEFYFERQVETGHELPIYEPCFASPVVGDNDPDPAYPFQLFTGRQRWFMQSMFADDPICVEQSGGHPATRLNPADAARLGLADGDEVEVYNAKGHVVTPLVLEESIPQGTVHVWFGWHSSQFKEGTYSEMVTDIAGPGIVNDVADKWWNDYQEQFPPAGQGSKDVMSVETGSWDAYWDCACNIRRWTH
ncbi:MAG: molybdopterin-dependent oxidoreductase [Coriobacteriales bacterium]|jgi:molybdopterin-containing oxidoreductase family molybdopterin binding subunit|nr:molybdopterin-dependent oxidoreductase [Coriobacteriales bacterium]